MTASIYAFQMTWHHQMTNHASYWSQSKSLNISIQLKCGSQPTKSLWVSTQRYPVEAPFLTKYSDIIRDLAARGYNWRYYDENFRYLRQKDPKAYSWGAVHWGLWIRSQPSRNSYSQIKRFEGESKSGFWVPKAHRLAGPFDTPPFPVFRVAPLGIVPKKTPGEFRLIHHLSYPTCKSVNDEISHEHSSVQYANIDHAIKKIKH